MFIGIKVAKGHHIELVANGQGINCRFAFRRTCAAEAAPTDGASLQAAGELNPQWLNSLT